MTTTTHNTIAMLVDLYGSLLREQAMKISQLEAQNKELMLLLSAKAAENAQIKVEQNV